MPCSISPTIVWVSARIAHCSEKMKPFGLPAIGQANGGIAAAVR